eukprot:gene9894-11719_t
MNYLYGIFKKGETSAQTEEGDLNIIHNNVFELPEEMQEGNANVLLKTDPVALDTPVDETSEVTLEAGEPELSEVEDMVKFFYKRLENAGETNKELRSVIFDYKDKDKARDEMLKLRQGAMHKARSVLADAHPGSAVGPEDATSAEEDLEWKVKEMKRRIKEETAAVEQLGKDLPAAAVDLQKKLRMQEGADVAGPEGHRAPTNMDSVAQPGSHVAVSGVGHMCVPEPPPENLVEVSELPKQAERLPEDAMLAAEARVAAMKASWQSLTQSAGPSLPASEAADPDGKGAKGAGGFSACELGDPFCAETPIQESRMVSAPQVSSEPLQMQPRPAHGQRTNLTSATQLTEKDVQEEGREASGQDSRSILEEYMKKAGEQA